MPQLSFLREPNASLITLGVMMPPPSAGRWSLALGMRDHDGRGCGDAAWSLGHGHEHADIGLVLKDAYDAWFNGDYWQVAPAIERSIRRRL